MLSRFAENSFWLSRYVERAENLARIIDVHETFSRDIKGTQDWQAIVNLQADEEVFFSKFTEASKPAVTYFYVLDKDNPSSIISCIAMARENARALRHLISTEMWTQLNVFYKDLCALSSESLSEVRLNVTLDMIKDACQLHSGISEGTIYRDEVHTFCRIGKMTERADMTSRLLDIKYHKLLPSLDDVGSIIDVNQWNILLRSVSGYHSYRRGYTGKMTAESVVGFMLFDVSFARSFVYCIKRLSTYLKKLDDEHGRKKPSPAFMQAREILENLSDKTAGKIIINGLHEELDLLQQQMIELTNSLYKTYFDF